MADLQAGLSLAIPAPPLTLVPVAGEDVFFPVRRIYCVGRNYAAHIREMGGDEREPPFFFEKPTDSIVRSGSVLPFPPGTKDFQYEVELVLAIGRQGRDVAVEDAASHVFGVAVGIDLTRRDLQIAARDKGRPWECGKSFDGSAPIGAIQRLAGTTLPNSGRIMLALNGATRQDGDLSQMIWSAGEIISHLSLVFSLEAGDLIYTGTPAGVGPIVPGDTLTGCIDGLPDVIVSVAAQHFR